MTATIATPRTSTTSGLTFGGIVYSEWIKFRSVRSTAWSYSIVIVVSVLIALLISSVPEILDVRPSIEESEFVFIQSSTIGASAGAIVMAVLGVLVMSGEYSTGMIRSTLAAVPSRLPVLAAKATVLFAATFIVGLVSSFGSALVVYPNLVMRGLAPTFSGPVVLSLVLSALYVAIVALFALGLGTILRNSAGGVSAALGVILLLPTMFLTIGALTQSEWILDSMSYLLPTAGDNMVLPTPDGLAQWQSALIAVVWATVSLAAGAALLKRRDA